MNCEVRQIGAVDTVYEVRQIGAVSLGGKQVALELSASSSGGLGVLLAQCLVYVNVSNRSHKASGFSDSVRWTERNQHVTCISGSSVKSTKTVCCLFSTAYSAIYEKSGVFRFVRGVQRLSFGVRKVVLELCVSSSSELRVLASQRFVGMLVSNLRAYQSNLRPILDLWLGLDHGSTCISHSSVLVNKTVHYFSHITHYAINALLAVCQLLRDMLCVNLWWTPKAFKGKGQALPQDAMSGIYA